MTSESPKPATHTRHEVRFTTLTVCNKNTTVSDTQITCKDIKLLMVKAIKVIFDLKVIVLYEKLVKASFFR